MKKLALAALFIGVASAAVAGGMAAPIMEVEPIVLEATSSSDAGMIIPLILIALIAAAMI